MRFTSFISQSLLAVSTLLSVAQSQNSFVENRQRYCAAGNLCVTSFDWCQFQVQNTSGARFNVGYCDRKGRGGAGDDAYFYSPSVGSTAGVAVTENAFYNLTWSGADASYPVKIDIHIGSTSGVTNGTGPTWSKNVTTPSYRFRFRDIWQELNDANTTTSANYRIRAVALGSLSYFTVSQPDRPAVPGLNFTEDSNTFVISNIDFQYVRRQEEEAFEESTARREHKWKLGVGLGVGLGVPVLLIAAFILGRMNGKKAGHKTAASNEVKRVSESTS